MSVAPVERVGRYLKLLGKKFEFDPTASKYRVIEKFDAEEFVVEISFTRNWAIILLSFGSIKDKPVDIRCKVFERLLKLNRQYAEVCFCIDDDYNVYCEEDILLDALTFDVFMEEYNAILISKELYDKEIQPLLTGT